MAGASPTRTHQLLEHNLRRRTHNSYTAGKRQHTHFDCRYSQSATYLTTGSGQQVVSSYCDLHMYVYFRTDLCVMLFFLRRWEGEGPCHPAGLPPPAYAPVNPSWAPCAPSRWGQAHPGACGRPQVAAGLSADPSASQRGHHHCCLLKSQQTNDLCPLIHAKM